MYKCRLRLVAIASCLCLLPVCVNAQEGAAEPAPTEIPVRFDGTELAKTVKTLNSLAKADFKEMEVKDTLDWLAQVHGLAFASDDVDGIATVKSEGAIGRLLDEIVVQIDHEYSIRPDGVIVIRPGLNRLKKRAGPSPEASNTKYMAYATSLVKYYDLDKDGTLNSEEIKKMRRPPVGVDTNKDGFITVDELVISLGGRSKK